MENLPLVESGIDLPEDASPCQPMSSELRSMRDALSMTIQRCHNPNCRDYKFYGGRGIKVDPLWRADFKNFLADMGVRPKGYTLERVDNNGPYTKNNCRWATRLEQANNQRTNALLTWKGKTQTTAAWERELGFNPGTVKARINRLGFTVEQALETPTGTAVPERPRKPKRQAVESAGSPQRPAYLCRALSSEEADRLRIRYKELTSLEKVAKEFGVSYPVARHCVNRTGAYK